MIAQSRRRREWHLSRSCFSFPTYPLYIYRDLSYDSHRLKLPTSISIYSPIYFQVKTELNVCDVILDSRHTFLVLYSYTLINCISISDISSIIFYFMLLILHKLIKKFSCSWIYMKSIICCIHHFLIWKKIFIVWKSIISWSFDVFVNSKYRKKKTIFSKFFVYDIF